MSFLFWSINNNYNIFSVIWTFIAVKLHKKEYYSVEPRTTEVAC